MISSFFEKCLLTITNTTMDINEKFGNATVTFRDNLPYGSVINVTFTNYLDIDKMFLYLRINMQQDENDEDYQREIIKCVADVGKLMKGVNANPILKHVKKDFEKYMDFALDFPLKKVRQMDSRYTSANDEI